MKYLVNLLTNIFRDSLQLYWSLLKIMVPVMVIVEIGVRFGLVEVIASICGPLMDLVGLPAEAAIPLATNLLVGIYGGVAALIPLLSEMTLSVADITILGSMMLIAHAIPIEQRIVQKIGCGLIIPTIFRLVSMVAYAWFLHLFYDGFDLLQEPATIPWAGGGGSTDNSFFTWAVDSALSLFWIFWIILALLTGLKIMEISGITGFLTKALAPALKMFGIGPNAAPLTMVGVLLGLTFGAGLIIREVEKGHLRPKSIFLATYFMILCHSMIEDTIVIMAMGGHWSGALAGRILLTIVIMIPLGLLIHRIPDAVFRKYLYRKKPDLEAQAAE